MRAMFPTMRKIQVLRLERPSNRSIPLMNADPSSVMKRIPTSDGLAHRNTTFKEDTMAGLEIRSFDEPDETRTPPKARIHVVTVGGATVAKATFEPGWRWSESIKPIAGTDSCGVHHLGLVLSGQMHVVHDDGSEGDIGPGQVYDIQPGHDAWVVGDEPMVGVEFDTRTAQTFAQD